MRCLKLGILKTGYETGISCGDLLKGCSAGKPDKGVKKQDRVGERPYGVTYN